MSLRSICLRTCCLLLGMIFLWQADASAQTFSLPATTIASLSSSGTQTDGTSASAYSNVSFSADDRYVAFDSEATDLVPSDTNGVRNVFVRDLQAGTTTCISVTSDGTPGDGDSAHPSMSADGRYVVFQSLATNLDANLANPGYYNIFLYDQQSGQVVSVTREVNSDPIPLGPNYDSTNPVISGDGTTIAFQSSATNLLPDSSGYSNQNGLENIYAFNIASNLMCIITPSGDGDSTNPSLCDDGSYVAFSSTADNLVSSDHDGVRDVFVSKVNVSEVEDYQGYTVMISTRNDGSLSTGNSDYPVISGDGTAVAFASLDSGLDNSANAGTTPGQSNVYIHDYLYGGTTTKIASVLDADDLGYMARSAISRDGKSVLFSAPFAISPYEQTFVWHRSAIAPVYTTNPLSVTPDGAIGNNPSIFPSISADGTVAGFYSSASNLVATDVNNAGDVFVTPAMGVVHFSSDKYTVARSGLAATLTVIRTGDLSKALTLACTTEDGSATAANGDYVPVNTTLVFAAGEAQNTVSVAIPAQDTVGDQDFFVILGNAEGDGRVNGNAMAQVSILQDTSSNYDLYGHNLFVSTVNYLPGDLDGTFDVSSFTLLNESGESSFTGRIDVVFAAFDGGKQIYATTVCGTYPFDSIGSGRSTDVYITPPDLNFESTLSATTTLVYYGVVYENTSLNGTVLQSAFYFGLTAYFPPGPGGGVPASGPGVNAPGYNGTPYLTQLQITGPNTVTGGDTVTFTTTGTMSDGSQVTGNPNGDSQGDPNWVASQFSIDTSGQLTTTMVTTDTVVTITATSTLGGTKQTATKTITISDPAPVGALQFDMVADTVEESAGKAVIKVDRINGSAGAVSVSYAVTGGSAVSGTDYTGGSGTLQFADGETSTVISIPLIDDHVAKPDRTLIVGLNTPTGGVTLGTVVSTTITIHADDAISAPVITSPSTASGQVNVTFTPYQIVASNSPTSYNATGLPAGLNVDLGTGLISGTPTQSGSFPANLSATNSAGTGTLALDLTIADAALSAPGINGTLTVSTPANQPFSYQITASNSPTSFAASPLPTGLTVDTATGLITGIPTMPNSYSVTLSATNAVGTGMATLNLTVLPSSSAVPVITSPSTASGQVNVTFTPYQIVASNSPTSYNATGLPASLSVNQTTGIISGVPTYADTFSVNLTANNAVGTGSGVLTLTIADAVLSKPIISDIALSLSTPVNQPFSYQITASNSPTSFAASPLPTGLTVDTATGLISGTPTQVGTFNVEISAQNGAGTDTATLVLTVNPPPPPTVTLTTLTPTITRGDGSVGQFVLTLSAPQASKVVIGYAVKGTAINGIDYVLISGTAKIKAGKTNKVINIIPKDISPAAANRVVKLVLLAGDGYSVGETKSSKIKILASQP